MKTAKTFFAKKFRNIMMERNMKQQDLADKLGVGQTMISQWLTGARNPNLNTIKRIAKALNISAQYFIEDINKENNQDIVSRLDTIEKQNKEFKNEISVLKKEILLLKKNFDKKM